MKKAHPYHPAKTRTGALPLISGVPAGRFAVTGPAWSLSQKEL